MHEFLVEIDIMKQNCKSLSGRQSTLLSVGHLNCQIYLRLLVPVFASELGLVLAGLYLEC